MSFLRAIIARVGMDGTDFELGAKKIEDTAAKLGHKTSEVSGESVKGLSGITRELLVVTREIANGNWTKVPGSVSILIQRLGLLKYIFNPVAAGLIAAGAAGYFFWQHLKKVNEQLDEVAKLNEKGFGNMGKSMQEAAKDAASAAADFDDWLRKLGDSQETLADKTEETIRLMREEDRLRKESIGSHDRAGQMRAEGDENRQELEVLNKALLEQRRIAENATSAATAANAAAFTGPGAIARGGKLHDLPGQISEAEKEKKFSESLVKALEAAVNGTHEMQLAKREVEASRPGSEREDRKRRLASVQRGLGGQEFEVEVEGKKHTMSLRAATEQLERYTHLQSTLNADQIRLTKVQRELADLARDGKALTERELTAKKRLEKERDQLAGSIALHKKYDPAISSHSGGHAGTADWLQRMGGSVGGAENVMVNVAREHLQVSRQIAKNTRPPAPHAIKKGDLER